MITKPARPPLPANVARSTRLFSVALAASILLSFLPVPLALIGLPFAVAGVVLGIMTMVMMRVGAPIDLWILMIFGLLVSGSFVLDYATAVVLYDEVSAYQDCSTDAITIAAADRCSREFEEAARERLQELGISSSWLLGSHS